MPECSSPHGLKRPLSDLCSGYHTVRHLVSHGALVYMGVRSPEKAKAAIDSILSLRPTALIKPLLLNHLDLSTVVKAAKSLTASEPQLHGLICNAGIMATPFEVSTDKHEAQWQTNYLAHWLLTHHLLPLLLATAKVSPSGAVRIVNVSGTAHQWAPKGGIDFNDINQTNGSALSRYAQSKLGNVLHAKTLNRLYGPQSDFAKAGNKAIWTASVQPGYVRTQLHGRATGTWMSKLSGIVDVVMAVLGKEVSIDEGSWTSLFAIAGGEFSEDMSGMYFEPFGKLAKPSKYALDEKLGDKLEMYTKTTMRDGGFVE